MAIQLRASSSFSSVPFSTRSYTHDVFLSFRGEDTRYAFTGHLHRYLVQRGVNVFIDDELTRGEEISQALLRAIEGSKLSLIVFSENYASSKWCLDELVHILGCRRSKNQMVRPIFYKVDPSDVRHQRGKFGEAVAEHELRFKDDMDKVLRWRAALSEAANLSGWHFSSGHEAKCIEEIVEKVSTQLKDRINLDVAECPVGIDSRLRDMLEILDVRGGDHIRMVGIWGSGGIGKTTIVKAVYNTVAHEFDGSCFLANVREGSEQHGGLVNLQNIILSKILGGKELKVINVDEGITLLRERLRCKRVLLVLDDVDRLDQLEKLAGRPDWFYSGSRVIITTRNKHLLIAYPVNQIYEARRLDHDEACELFCANAFKTDRNMDNDEKHAVNTIVNYAKGLPLALKVLGSHLCSRRIDQWQALLDDHRRSPLPGIQKILKISYDALEQQEREIFLDIACFFKNKNKNDVIAILEGCDYNNPMSSIEVLEEKALLNVEHAGIFMHDLLEEMGKKIVHEESPKEPGRRTRLWYHKDVLQVLTENTGTSKIEGMMVKMPKEDEIRLSPKCFKKMRNLKIFINVNGRFCGNVDCFPNQLRLLDWRYCPLQSLPSDFNMKNLVQLSMPCSRISRFGEGFKSMENLISLNLKRCELLASSPDVSGSPNLEFLDLSFCNRLKKIHPSVGSLKKLVGLDLRFCTSLKKIHPSIESLKKLVHLNLSWCRRLEEVHPSVGSLEKLVDLDLEGCSKLQMLPGEVNWRSLREINLRFCGMLESFPEIVGEMKYMTSLTLLDVGIKALPSSIKYLINLERLVLDKCGNLTDLPCSMQNLKSLKLKRCGFVRSPDLSGCPNLEVLYLSCCEWLEEVHPSVGSLEKLVHLDLLGCSKLRMLPGEVNSRSLKTIKLDGCRMLERFPEIVGEMKYMTSLTLLDVGIKALPSSIRYLINLEWLVLDKCGNLTDLPCSMQNLKSLELKGCGFVRSPDLSGCPNLEVLYLSCCERLEEVHPSVGSLEKLVDLDLEGCSKLRMLPGEVNWRSLREINLRFCRMLESFPEIVGEMKYMTSLTLLDVGIKALPSSIRYLINLERLVLDKCGNLTDLPCSMQNLKSLKLKGCGFVRSPDLSGCPNLEVLYLSCCERLEEVHPSVGSLEKLVDLDLEGCSKLRMLPGEVNWRSLREINLRFCRMLESFPEIVGEMKYMTSLTLLDVGIKALPSSIRYLINLERLVLNKCGNLTDLPCSIYELQNLKEVGLYYCAKLVRFPECSNEIDDLWSLDLRGCTRLVEIPELPPSIRRLDVSDCVSLERISKLSNILERKESQMIEEMNLTNCWRLCQNLVQMANKDDDDDEVDADLFSRLLSSQQSKFTIRFPVPRSEVPKWFSCQMDFMGHRRFEFYIEALANFKWDNTGLALCVAVDQKPQVTCFEVHIHINEVRVSNFSHPLFGWRYLVAESDHVWLHYVSFLEIWRFGYMRPLPPFTCRVIIYQYGKSIKSCGVHLVMPPNEDVCMKLIRAENLTSEPSEFSDDDDDDEFSDDDDVYTGDFWDNYRPKQRTDCKELYTDAQLENEKL